MVENSEAITIAAKQHGLSDAAVRTLWDALVAGRGVQAQFSHPEVGGMGQWSGGTVQIGDMFNQELKAKVAAALAALAPLAVQASQGKTAPLRAQAQWDGSPTSVGSGAWWPADLGQPGSSGAQNDTRYAFFPDRRRLAVDRDGAITVYDTGEHRIFGFSQHQSTCSAMAFTSQTGPVMLDALPIAAG